MIRTWVADVTPLYDEKCYNRYYEGLPSFRKEKADALKYLSGKAQSVGVWVLWEKMRSRYGLAEDASFNLSHSGDWVMCAAQTEGKQAQVGCDIEKLGTPRLKVAERRFCREEYERIMKAETEKEQQDCFFRYWVLKESFMKATRRGMGLPLDAFCIQLEEPPRLIRQPAEYPLPYYYREYTVEAIPCKMAVCSTDREIDAGLTVCSLADE